MDRLGIQDVAGLARFAIVQDWWLSGVYGGFCLDLARQPGAAAALSKPITNDVLIRTIDATLNRSTPANGLSVAAIT